MVLWVAHPVNTVCERAKGLFSAEKNIRKSSTVNLKRVKILFEMKNIKMEIQKNGNRWRVILDGVNAEPARPQPLTPYEELKLSLGLTGERSKDPANRVESFGEYDAKPVYGSDAEAAVETAFTSFYNHGIADHLEWVDQNKSKGWFWVSGKTTNECRVKLLEALRQMMVAKLLGDCGGVAFKSKSQGVWPLACEMAMDIYKGMESCPDFVDYKNATPADPLNLDGYSIGTIKAESPSE
jgi:hypothetical protein